MTRQAFREAIERFAAENDVPVSFQEMDGNFVSFAQARYDEGDEILDTCIVLSDDTAVFSCTTDIDFDVNSAKVEKVGELMKQRFGFDYEYYENENSVEVSVMLDYKKADGGEFPTADLIEYSIYRSIDLAKMYFEALCAMKAENLSPMPAVELIAQHEGDICGYFDFL